jgi:hypothetical protein
VAAEWAALEVLISVDEGHKILLEISNGSEELVLRINHDLAASIAEGLLIKVAEVECDINDAVERLTKFE